MARGLAYRDAALASPHLYPVMFGQADADLNPDLPARQAARDALDVLAATIRRGVRGGVFPSRSARRLTLAAWALVHGLVSLELDGKLPPASRPAADYQAILRATVTGWQHTSPR